MTEPRPPAPRHATLRQALAVALRREQLSAHDLSRLVGISEKMSYLHFSGHTNYPNGKRRCVHEQSAVRSRL